MDAVPGQRTRLVVTPTKNGTYPLLCTELCGLGHSVMRSESVVMDPKAFDKWLEDQQEAVGGDIETDNPGLAVYTENGCANCHQISGVDSEAESGPNLDELSEHADDAGKPLEEYIRESIVSPSAYVVPDFPDIMPKTYSQLSDQELDALVAFLADPPEPEADE
jgi:cytochrome c oxidase subunit 2